MADTLDLVVDALDRQSKALEEQNKLLAQVGEKVDHMLTMATVVNAIFDKVAALPTLEEIKKLMSPPAAEAPTPAEPEKVLTAAEAWQKLVDEGKA